jgi:hypothetical protein
MLDVGRPATSYREGSQIMEREPQVGQHPPGNHAAGCLADPFGTAAAVKTFCAGVRVEYQFGKSQPSCSAQGMGQQHSATPRADSGQVDKQPRELPVGRNTLDHADTEERGTVKGYPRPAGPAHLGGEGEFIAAGGKEVVAVTPVAFRAQRQRGNVRVFIGPRLPDDNVDHPANVAGRTCSHHQKRGERTRLARTVAPAGDAMGASDLRYRVAAPDTVSSAGWLNGGPPCRRRSNSEQAIVGRFLGAVATRA